MILCYSVTNNHKLEKENSRLKNQVADIALDNAILKEAARGNF
jgi:hypothetical protein